MFLQRLFRRGVAPPYDADARLILEGARHLAIVTLDRNGIITSWNVGAERLLGHAAGDAVRRSQQMLFTVEDIASGAPAVEMQQSRVEGRAAFERWHVRRDGSRLWASGLLMPLPGGGFLRVFHDRTEGRRALQRLEQSVSELQQAQRVARVGSWIWKADSDVVAASDELYRIYGLDPRTETFPRFAEQRGRLFPRESWEQIEAAVRHTLETGAGFELDVRAYRGSGVIWTARKGEALRGPDGRVIGVVGTVQDITERREAEETLRASEERVRLATEAGQIGLFDWDLRTGALRWDKRLRAMWSLAEDAPVSIDVFYAGLHPDDVGRVRGLIAASHNPAGDGGYEVEYRVIGLSDRKQRHVSARGRTTFAGGRAVRMLGTAVDVTPVREAEAVLARDREELERLMAERTRELEVALARLAHSQRMEALGQLAGGIAHDFNNVLQAVQGGAALIERRPADPEGVRRIARMVFDAAGRGSSVTRRLLAFARRGDLRAEAVDPAALLTDMREILTHTLGTGIGVQLDLAHGLPSLFADKGQLETALINLASNARDALNGKGAIILAAELRAIGGGEHGLQPGAYVCLSVSDAGTGMSSEVIARATEPFFTTKRKGEGTGLGLAMARGFAEQRGGALAIDSAVGRGTRVSLFFPVADAEEAVARPQGERDAGTEARRRSRLLVIDDEPLVREIITEQLDAEGYSVVSAANGAEALAMLDAGEEVDLVISDFSMPGMDGVALVGEVQRRRPKLPAILLTGFATNAAEIAVSGAVSGTFSLLRKPIAGQQLAERVAMMLEGAAAARSPAG